MDRAQAMRLAWFFDNALRKIQIACTFSDIGDELMDVAQERLDARQAFRQMLDKGWGQLM